MSRSQTTKPRTSPRARQPLAVWFEPAPVRQWMRRPVVTVEADALVPNAVAMMKAHQVRHLPVLDGGRLVGIVTDRDLRQLVFDPAIRARLDQTSYLLSALSVREVMTWGVVTVRPDTDMREAVRVMREQKLGALPVVSGGKLVGILTERDALKALEALLRTKVSRVQPLPASQMSADAYDHGFLVPARDGSWSNEGPGN
jgi:acetoin utilization protein AcuB